MNCAQFEKLIALDAGGDLPERQAARVREHLLECPHCRELAESLQESQAALRRLHQESVDPAVFENMRAGVLAQLAGERPRQLFYRRWWTWALAGACLLLAAMLVFRPRPASQPPPGRVAAVPPQPPAAPAPSVRPPQVKVARVHRSRAHRPIRRPATVTPSEPLLVKLVTDDPNIVIYWIIDRKGDGS